MVIAILLVGITLSSLGYQYLNYKEDIKQLKEKYAEFYRKQNFDMDSDEYTNLVHDWEYDYGTLKDNFKVNIIVYSIIIGFIILSEIGLLIAMNPRNNKHEVTLKRQ